MLSFGECYSHDIVVALAQDGDFVSCFENSCCQAGVHNIPSCIISFLYLIFLRLWMISRWLNKWTNSFKSGKSAQTRLTCQEHFERWPIISVHVCWAVMNGVWRSSSSKPPSSRALIWRGSAVVRGGFLDFRSPSPVSSSTVYHWLVPGQVRKGIVGSLLLWKAYFNMDVKIHKWAWGSLSGCSVSLRDSTLTSSSNILTLKLFPFFPPPAHLVIHRNL